MVVVRIEAHVRCPEAVLVTTAVLEWQLCVWAAVDCWAAGPAVGGL